MLKGDYPEESRMYDMVEHLQNFTLNSFKRLLDEAGLKIVEINPDFGQIPKLLSYFPRFSRKRVLTKYPNLFGYQVVLSIKKGHKNA